MKVDIHYHLKSDEKPIVATVDGVDNIDDYLDELHESLDGKFIDVEGRGSVIEVLLATDAIERIYVVEALP